MPGWPRRSPPSTRPGWSTAISSRPTSPLADDGPRVIDFGITRALDGTTLTEADVVIGSAGYMSPEQADGRAIGPASDVFSLGSVLVFAATGRPPFGEGSAHSLLYRVSHSDPGLTGVPASLRGVIAACMNRDPARRPDAGRRLEDNDDTNARQIVSRPQERRS